MSTSKRPPLAQNVRLFRRALDWTQEELAKKANVSPSIVAIIEANCRPKTTPKPETIQALANALGVTVGKLVTPHRA